MGDNGSAERGTPPVSQDEYQQFVDRLLSGKRTGHRQRRKVPSDTDLVAPDIKPVRPPGCETLRPTPAKVDQIVFAHLARSLEILTAIAECTTIPIGIRQRAAEVVVDTGVGMLRGPKGVPIVKHGMPAAAAQQGALPRSVDPPEPEPEDVIPPGWGESPDEESELPDAPPDPVLPAPPPDLNFEETAKQRRKAEEHVLRLLREHQSMPKRLLKGATMGNDFKQILDLDEVIAGMLAKGLIKKHVDPASSAVVYHLPTFTIEPLPPLKAKP